MKTTPTFIDRYEKIFYSALRIRLVEEKIAEIYPSDKIQSPVHLSIGQEHLAAALCDYMKPTDLVFGTYRSHAIYLAKGGSLNAMMSELFGKVSGCGRGKAGSMHLSHRESGVMGASAIVGATIPHAVGAALGAKVRRSGQVVSTFFGEGATGQGVYHESLNIAALKSLPVMFVCESNGLAIYTNSKEIQSYNLRDHAASFGMHTEVIEDGYNIEALMESSEDLISFVREKQKPLFVEIRTHRTLQHVGPNNDDNMNYRADKDAARWASRDPLVQRQDLVEKFKPSILREIEESILFAEQDRFPGESELFADIF